jgi:NAD(P)-dependent dehydrogenase (short-subunit alcohol dehydrogenase family)
MQVRVALVTGASRGIGRQVAFDLARDGYRVIVTARTLADARRTAAAIAADGRHAEALALDVTDEPSVEALATRVDRLHVLVNNAAGFYDEDGDVLEPDLDAAAAAYATNVLGVWRVTCALLPSLRAAAPAARRIVNVSSTAGSLESMSHHAPAYSATKTALNALTVQLAAHLRDEGILVNAVCPGRVATRMTRGDGRPPAAGAASVLWAVRLPDDGPSGGFFRWGERVPW